jgi:protein-disulfide isomerase
MSALKPPVTARDHALGPEAAPVTLVEYGDYQCPHCGAAHPVVKALKRHFGPRMRLVFRHFPLTQVHPRAESAAEAAEAAASVGKFWEMHDAIFEHQDALEDEDLLQYAEEVGVNPAVVASALAARSYAPRIKEDFMSGVRSGVNGTPSFFVNGEKYEGPYDLGSLREAIEEELQAV